MSEGASIGDGGTASPTGAAVKAYLDRLQREERPLPSYRGRAPRLILIARETGVSYAELLRSPAARTLLDAYGEANGYEPDLGTEHIAVKRLIADYARRKRAPGGGSVPRDPRRPGAISHQGVAREIGVAYEGAWVTSITVKHFITQELSGIPLGDAIVEAAYAPDAHGLHRRRMEEWDGFLTATYDEPGRPVPESTRRDGIPDYRALEAEKPFVVGQLSTDTAFRRRLRETIGRVGLRRVAFAVAPTVTWDQVIAFARAARLERTQGTKTSVQAADNLVSAGRGLMAALGRVGGDPCDGDLADPPGEGVAAFLDSMSNVQTRRRRRTDFAELASCQALLSRRLGLPGTLREALVPLAERAGVSLHQVERRLDIPKGTLSRWSCGLGSPSPTSLPYLTAVDGFFGLPPGSLAALLPERTFGTRACDGPSLSAVHSAKVVRHLPPDFAERSADEQAEIVEFIRTKILRQDSPYSIAHGALTKDEYRLKLRDWPGAAQAEWRAVERFHKSPLPPVGMKRPEGTHWSDDNGMVLSWVERFYGFAVRSADDGGLGYAADHVGLWMLAVETNLQGFVDWCQRRRGGALNTGDIGFLGAAASLLRADDGFIPQTPALASRMVVRDGVLAACDARKARSGWRAYCRRAEERARALSRDVQADIDRDPDAEARRLGTRDPFEPVESLLSLERPMKAYREAILLMEAACPEAATSPAYHHVHKRDCVLARLLSVLAFRSKNMRKMTWRADATGHLRKEDGRWVVRVPRREFKNPNSSFFGPPRNKVDYEKVLEDEDGLYALLEYYVTVSRPCLLRGGSHDELLIVLGRPYTKTTFYGAYRGITEKHLAHNPYTGTGIPGVMPHGPHAVRHIMATSVLKETGRFDLAAASIQDTEQTVRIAYGRYLPKDANRLIEMHLNDGRTPASTAELVKLRAENRALRAELAEQKASRAA